MRLLPSLTIALSVALAFAPPASAQEGTAPQGATPLPPDLDDILADQLTAEAEAMAATLAQPVLQERALALAAAQTRLPGPARDALMAGLAGLLQDDAARQALAVAMRDQFDQFGIDSPTDEQISRVAATLLPPWALDSAAIGLPQLPVADQRALLSARRTIAESLSVERCEMYLSDYATDARAVELSAIAALPPEQAAVEITRLMAASRAAHGDKPATATLAPADEDEARRTLGVAIMAAVDASPDPDRLIAALSPTAYVDPADGCAARLVVLRAALDMPAPAGDQAIRLIAAYGLDGS
jgi:hypothetical protein